MVGEKDGKLTEGFRGFQGGVLKKVTPPPTEKKGFQGGQIVNRPPNTGAPKK